MDKIKFDNEGGLWFTQDVLAFLQAAIATSITGIVAALGNNVILQGCIVTGSNVSSGFVIINGEILPFKAGGLAANISVQEVAGKEQYDNGTQQDTYFTRTAILSNAAGGIVFNTMPRIKNLQAFLNLPNTAGADYSASNDNMLATITGLYNLKQELNNIFPIGMMTDWPGSIDSIPVNYRLCNGQLLNIVDFPDAFAAIGAAFGGDGLTNFALPNVSDRFTVAAGNKYGLGEKDGEEKHVLTIGEMPNHSHTFSGSTKANADGNDNQRGLNQTWTTQSTSAVGGGLAHNNMPPYFGAFKVIRVR